MKMRSLVCIAFVKVHLGTKAGLGRDFPTTWNYVPRKKEKFQNIIETYTKVHNNFCST